MPVANAVLGLRGVVGVGRAVKRLHFGVGLGPLVLVADHDGDGRAEREALERAGEDVAGVAFLARGDDLALPGTAAIEIDLDVGLNDGDARGAAIDDNADAAAMGLAPGGDLKEMAKGVRHGIQKPNTDGEAAEEF